MLAYTSLPCLLGDIDHCSQPQRTWSSHAVNPSDSVRRLTLCLLPHSNLRSVGTVLGFVISYRTTSSFERYNEGRRLWSQITLASRTFSRTVWFHVPRMPAIQTCCSFLLNYQSIDAPPAEGQSEDDSNARSTIEKKTVINLVEAFSVAIKHYLRGEDGIYYRSFQARILL